MSQRKIKRKYRVCMYVCMCVCVCVCVYIYIYIYIVNAIEMLFKEIIAIMTIGIYIYIYIYLIQCFKPAMYCDRIVTSIGTK